MPCSNPNIDIASGPSPVAIQNFGVPFAPSAPNNPIIIPNGQPEDLNAIFNAIQLIVPSGSIKPSMHSNYDRTIFDAIMKVMELFTPFLMLYKMVLPVLNIIVCIIEVLCSLMNPFKLIEKIQKLFRTCIPDLLALFPQFAIPIMILSIINLLIALVEYLITEITNLVAIIQKNINVIKRSLTLADDRSIIAATEKIGAVLCSFQNLFVLLSVFETIIAVFEIMIKLLFPLPPCDDGAPNSCCGPDVCPSFLKNNTDINASTGSLQYYNEAGTSFIGLPFISDERAESWQFYDTSASQQLALINITHAYDLPDGYNTIFFPTDATYDGYTPPSQAPYLINLRLFYTPTTWGVSDPLGSRFIRINNCIITAAPSYNLSSYDNSQISVPTGVIEVVGGSAFEDDGATPLLVNGAQGSLNTLIHMAANISSLVPPTLSPTDGYLFTNITYDFIIQHPILLSKGLITLGCVPNVGLDRMFINTVYGSNANFTFLNNLALPDVAGAQLCLSTAVAALQSSVSDQSLATFQAATTACLSSLLDQTITTGSALVDASFDPYKSSFTISPTVQFTTETITVSVALVENTGAPLASNLPNSMSSVVAGKIQATITFGEISNFIYDGYSLFTAEISATSAGSGSIQIAYQNQVISTVTIPADLTQSPSISPVVLDYSFIYSPSAGSNKTSVGDTEGAPRLGNSDISEAGG